MTELISNHDCKPMYRPLSVTGDLQPGKGDFSNTFPVSEPVYFIHTVDAGKYEGLNKSFY